MVIQESSWYSAEKTADMAAEGAEIGLGSAGILAALAVGSAAPTANTPSGNQATWTGGCSVQPHTATVPISPWLWLVCTCRGGWQSVPAVFCFLLTWPT